MHDDDIDLPEPEHEHLLDHEWDEDSPEDFEHDATGLRDEPEDDQDDWDDEDDEDDGAHWHDD